MPMDARDRRALSTLHERRPPWPDLVHEARGQRVVWRAMSTMRRETEAAIRAAVAARRIADSRHGADQIRSKGGIDLVTASDVACEDAIRAELARDFPEHPVVGEERGGTPVADRPYWLVDPICGTRPFASDVPLYCTNVALVEDGVPTVAAVAVGRSQDVLWAERGRGARLRGAAGDETARAHADSDTVWFSGREALAADVVRAALLDGRWYVWQFSSTLAYAYLATGRVAGIVHSGTTPVHVAAGCLIAAEAGALVTDLDGGPWHVAATGVLAAATPALHAELLALIERCRPASGLRGYDHLAITVADVERTVAFYRDVLGARVLYEDEWRSGRLPIAMLQIGANRMNVHPAAAPAAPHATTPTPGSVDLCFRWDAPLEAAVALLQQRGIAIIEGPVPRPAADGAWGRSVYFRDPDGNLLELLSTAPA
jgi:fructose-1,6-bisphosphatase/inositol monophosphatase family enzyme/catechol 2,3-dioxygenase-like lactoylglutathione lyase family enzyme